MPTIIELVKDRSDRIAPETSLREAASRMLERGISSVIVVENGVAVGIVTESDLLRAMRRGGSPEQPARETMSSPVHSVTADTDFRAAYREAAHLGIRRIVVTDQAGLPVGTVNESDFRKYLGPDFFMHLNSVDTLMETSFPRLPPDAGLGDALTAMEAVRCSCAIVVDGRRPLGIVTEHDVVRLFLRGEGTSLLGAVMTSPTIGIGFDRPLAEAAQRMLDHGIRHLAVVDRDGNLVGLLSEHALMTPLKHELLDHAICERQAMAQAREKLLEDTARKERYQRALLDNFPFPVWLKDTESRFLTVNRALAEAAECDRTDSLIGKNDLDLWPQALAEHYRADDRAIMASRQKKVIVEPVMLRRSAVWHETYKAPVVDEDGALLGTVGFAQDISERRRAAEAMHLRNTALSALIGGDSLDKVLELIALSFEAEIPGWRCSIMLADPQGRSLSIGAAPSMPAAYHRAIDGLAIAPDSGSSGAAAALRQRIIVDNVFEHPNWVRHCDLAKAGTFSACWSEPVLGSHGQLLGTFTAYYRSPAKPTEAYLGLIAQAAHMTALIVEHLRNAEERSSSLNTFRGIFDSIGEALFIQADDRRFLDANSSAEQLFGFPRGELIGQTHEFLVLPGLCDLPAIDDRISAALSGLPQVFETLARNARGQIFPIEVRLHTASYFGRSVLIASAVDIAERKNAALRLEIEHDLAQRLAAEPSREKVMASLLKAMLRFPELSVGSAYLPAPDGSYQLLAHEGLSLELIGRTLSFPSTSPFARQAGQGKPVCLPLADTGEPPDSHPLDPAILRDDGLRCLVLLPILIEECPIACLLLGGKLTSCISPATLHSLETLGRSIGQTVQRLNALDQSRRLQQNLSGVFDALSDFIFVLDSDGIILHYNRAVTETLGYDQEALKGKPILTVHPANLREQAEARMADILAGRTTSCPLPILCVNGNEIQIETRVMRGYWDGKPVLIGVSQDISERLRAEERQRLAASVFDNAHEGIMITNQTGRIVEVNSTFTELTGYSRAEAIGQTPELLKSGHHDAAFYEQMWQTIEQDGYWQGEIWNRKKSGEIFVEQLTISAVHDGGGSISHYVAIFSDITVIKQHQQRLEHLAHFDALTQLPNRMLLGDRMRLAMAQTERSGKMLAVCYLDLDNFKPINDEFGHSVGDYLLIDVAQRLKTCVRAGDTVARLGGDEFVLLIANLDDLHECELAMGRIISALAQPFRVSQRQVSVAASIGVTLYPHDGADSDTLLRHADQAMYAAKQAGLNRYHLFDPENDRRARIRREEIGRIREALAGNEFRIYFQPKVDMRKGTVVGAEALIRWQHPERGVLLPASFLPVVEGTETAIEIGDWVIDETLRQLDAWLSESGLRVSVSINIAGNHLQNPGFSQRLSELLGRYPAVQPQQIELEILETAALADVGTTAALFAECRDLGVSFALDDFGTGYSSLTYFRRLPADILKIDQSFVRDMLDNPDDLAIVEGVIGLTQAFRRSVIAEGVETVEHGLVLLLLGCDMAQGFGIARPMPAAELPGWIARFQPDELWNLGTAFNWSREDLPMLIAEVDHKRWTRSLHAYLDDTTGSTPPPATEHATCRFARWYNSTGSQRYAAIEAFGTIPEIHARAHAMGAQLIGRHQAGDIPARDALRQEFCACTAELNERIRQTQAEVLISAQSRRR
ncbi:EAL domain-containing protein [uncultured Dechloromonas sp.]|uniref:EAL domain-containing protein n=1 Tax=uncultured Dechloromonas sp. TaxID=171719 RepID=UPI0025EA9CE4|nr:EAL domain-containing protein [uncultured Dechloromonas sp.]